MNAPSPAHTTAPVDNAYLSGMYAPVHAEIAVDDLKMEGALPPELAGMFVRNSPNPRFEPQGRYHWFDGDGMMHGLLLRDGKASYRNRYVQTRGFQAETKENHALWGGILEPVRIDHPYGPLKNTSNTDVVWHAGKLLSLWWLCGEPYQMKLPTLETVGPYKFQGRLTRGMSSHPKVDKITKELMFMDFSVIDRPPYLTYTVVGADGQLIQTVPIDIPKPRILHDLAITEHYTILIDVPLGWDAAAMKQGKRKITFEQEIPARFGILPRYGNNDDIRWFEAASCYIYHTINAYEENDEIVLTGCRVENPIPKSKEPSPTIPRLYFLELQPFFYRWRFNLKTGSVHEEPLDDISTEFPRMNNELLGRRTRYSYNPRVAPRSTLIFDGLIKYDTHTGRSETYAYGPHRSGGEAVFAQRPGSTVEDEGWVMTFVYDEREDTSEFIVLDAQHFNAGPLARIAIPHRVPHGFHAWWVTGEELQISA